MYILVLLVVLNSQATAITQTEYRYRSDCEHALEMVKMHDLNIVGFCGERNSRYE